MKALSVSVVIPAYNEETHLRACLEALARQTVKPFEVIVVDNNSTDATAAIARSFSFVRLITEKKQGPVHARDAGFDAARGDIIGRLDGDSVVEHNWIETIQKVFIDHTVEAATGVVQYREVCAIPVFNALDLYFRSLLARRSLPLMEQSMQGVNLAIRTSTWADIGTYVCRKREHHEDIDLAAHLALHKRKVVFDPRMVVSVTFRQADAKPATFFKYVMSTPRTYRLHGLKMNRDMYFVAWLVIAIYAPIRIAYRGYNPTTGKFSLRCLFNPEVTTHRPSPVSQSLGVVE